MSCKCTYTTLGMCASCIGEANGLMNNLAAQQNMGQLGGVMLTPNPPIEQGVYQASLGMGQPGIADMERAAYDRGVAAERKRIEDAITQVRVAIEKFEDAPASADAHIMQASKLLGDRLAFDRKPHPGWKGGPIDSPRKERGSVVAEYELDIDGTIRCRAAPLNTGRCQWQVESKGDYENAWMASGGVDGADSLEMAQLEAEDALAKILANALEELRRGT